MHLYLLSQQTEIELPSVIITKFLSSVTDSASYCWLSNFLVMVLILWGFYFLLYFLSLWFPMHFSLASHTFHQIIIILLRLWFFVHGIERKYDIFLIKKKLKTKYKFSDISRIHYLAFLCDIYTFYTRFTVPISYEPAVAGFSSLLVRNLYYI